MKTNDKPFYTPIFRLRTGVFIRVNYSCPACVILIFTSLNKNIHARARFSINRYLSYTRALKT